MKDKLTVARDNFRYHDVVIALSKAKAMASVLGQLGAAHNPISNNLVHALQDGSHPEETLDWLQDVVGEALRAALDDAEAAFRKSITPEEAHRQVVGDTGPKAVA